MMGMQLHPHLAIGQEARTQTQQLSHGVAQQSMAAQVIHHAAGHTGIGLHGQQGAPMRVTLGMQALEQAQHG